MADEKELNGEGCAPEQCAGCAHADSCPSKMAPEDFLEPQNQFSDIKHVIGIVHPEDVRHQRQRCRL